MFREILKTKLHRLTVTEADLNYEGSVTLDEDLMDAGDIMEYEKVMIADVTNGNRFETYAIKGVRGSGVVCINGAAAHLAKKGDIIILFTFTHLADDFAKSFKPTLVYVDEHNKIKRTNK